MLALEAWMVIEAILLWPKVCGVLEETAARPQPAMSEANPGG